jgi:hypothetical protein
MFSAQQCRKKMYRLSSLKMLAHNPPWFLTIGLLEKGLKFGENFSLPTKKGCRKCLKHFVTIKNNFVLKLFIVVSTVKFFKFKDEKEKSQKTFLSHYKQRQNV